MRIRCPIATLRKTGAPEKRWLNCSLQSRAREASARSKRRRNASNNVDLSGDNGYSWRAMMRKSYARLVCPSVALAALALACCASQWHPGIQNFKKIEIDPTTLKVTLEEPLPLNSPVGYDYYALFRGATTVTVDHGGPSGSKIAYNALDLDDDGNLLMRIKSQVLAQGPYGTIY